VTDKLRSGIEVEHTLAYSVLETKYALERADIAEWYVLKPDSMFSQTHLQTPHFRHQAVPGLLSSGKVRFHNIDQRKGLGAIPEGLDEMKQGKVSGKRIVYTLP
jgi:hypothetical protein